MVEVGVGQSAGAIQAGSGCASCGRLLREGRRFIFKVQGVEVVKCLWCCFRHKPMLRRSVMASLVVGALLTAINQGTVLFAGSWDNALYWKIPLTFCVPFCVATYGALVNSRS